MGRLSEILDVLNFKTLYFNTISQAALIFGNADLKT